MAVATLIEPLSDEEPCGQDLDLEEDGAYFQYMASINALLPDSYMVEEDGKNVPFHTSQRFQTLDLNGLIGSGAKLIARTHDLRILATQAKLTILNRSLARFEAAVDTMAALLETFPEQVHPQGQDERAGALERLTDPLILSALNNAALFKSRRFGVVTWASYIMATRTDESAGGTEAVDRILREEVKADPEPITEAQAAVGKLQGALGRILAACPPGGAPDLHRLTGQLTTIAGMMQRIHPTDDGAAQPAGAEHAAGAAPQAGAPAQPGGPPPGAALPILSDAAAAEAALAEAERFFAAVEPSSPCLLLLRQAQALAGKSFLEALQALAPDSLDKAVFQFGATPTFDLPLRRIAPAESAEEASAARKPAGRPVGTATSRADALGLLDQVSAFYRFVEPSSPIPMLVDRARSLAGKDFATLLKTMLPEKAEGSSSGW